VTQPTEFPEYGGVGNKADARRMRRSFRICVFAVIFFVGILWFSERYLTNDLAETQYIAGLTLAPESARSFLRSAVRHDGQHNETPSVKYLQALAEREEQDLILPVYQQAYELDPTDPFLGLRYGCQLYVAEHYAKAAERFRETRNHPPKNALAGYLEAAAIAGASANSDLSESIALIAKINENNAPVIFPEPLWSDALPKQGYWYQKLRRQAVEECLQPINVFTDQIISQAKTRIAVKYIQSWDARLQTLQTMGERIVKGPSQGSVQAMVGIRIQLAALELRQDISSIETGRPDSDLAEIQSKLTDALNVLNEFEATRDQIIETHSSLYVFPFKLILLSLIVLIGSYTVATVITAVAGTGKDAWDLRHSKLGIGVIVGGTVALLMLLLCVAVVQTMPASVLAQRGGAPLHNIQILWWTLVSALVVFGVLYPHFRLPKVSDVITQATEPAEGHAHKSAQKRRRIAYCAFVRRYYGIACGLFFVAVAIWTASYRTILMLYPWQVELLVSGLQREEAEAVVAALSMIP